MLKTQAQTHICRDRDIKLTFEFIEHIFVVTEVSN